MDFNPAYTYPNCTYMRWHRKNERNKTITTFFIGAIYGACAGFIGGVVFFNLVIR